MKKHIVIETILVFLGILLDSYYLICSNCNRVMPYDKMICPYCGKIFEEQIMKKRRCKKCGKLFIPTNMYDYTCEICSMED